MFCLFVWHILRLVRNDYYALKLIRRGALKVKLNEWWLKQHVKHYGRLGLNNCPIDNFSPAAMAVVQEQLRKESFLQLVFCPAATGDLSGLGNKGTTDYLVNFWTKKLKLEMPGGSVLVIRSTRKPMFRLNDVLSSAMQLKFETVLVFDEERSVMYNIIRNRRGSTWQRKPVAPLAVVSAEPGAGGASRPSSYSLAQHPINNLQTIGPVATSATPLTKRTIAAATAMNYLSLNQPMMLGDDGEMHLLQQVPGQSDTWSEAAVATGQGTQQQQRGAESGAASAGSGGGTDEPLPESGLSAEDQNRGDPSLSRLVSRMSYAVSCLLSTRCQPS